VKSRQSVELILSAEEREQARSQPALAVMPGRRTSNYVRHGTTRCSPRPTPPMAP